jgi:catechol 2,3-dioxygenase-like lactoylglutathione lyase family enzyme
MLDRSRIVSRDIIAAYRFYSAAARPLGLTVTSKDDGFAVGEAIQVKALNRAEDEEPETRPTHVALEAPDAFTVRSFFRAALEAGGRQLGYPSPQPTGGQGAYYSARVIDPDGNCIECGWRH